MKLNNIVKIVLAGSALSLIASCHNQEQIFPDYDGGITAYFAYQYPVRTIVLGESETFDTTLDNEGKFTIYGTMGGAYQGKDIVIDIEVDETLTDNLFFDAECTKPVKALPETHYNPIATQLNYGGSHMGGVEVQLTDAFFDDKDAIKTTYVLPVKMTRIVKGADQILTGTPAVEGEPAWRTDASQWKTLPKDYTLYAVKYINKWDGSWLRRGKDVITDVASGEVTEDVRHKQYVENDEVMFLTTESLNSVTFPMTINVTQLVPPPPEYALKVTNESLGNNYGAQLVYVFGEPLKAGVTYTFSCMTKATADYESNVFLADKDSGSQQYGSPNLVFTTEWTKRSIDITPGSDVIQELMFNFGDFEGSLWFDRVSVTEKGKPDELVVNGDFSEGNSAGWNSWGSVSAGWGAVPEGYTETTPQPTLQIVPKATNLVLTFKDDGTCIVSSATEGITASGTGTFVKDGEKLAWGNKDRDGIYLDYEVDFGEQIYTIKDTLVSRHREVVLETFSPTFKK